MNIIILGVRIIEDSDNRGSDNRGCTVYMDTTVDHFTPLAHHKDFSLERCQSSQYAAETAILICDPFWENLPIRTDNFFSDLLIKA